MNTSTKKKLYKQEVQKAFELDNRTGQKKLFSKLDQEQIIEMIEKNSFNDVKKKLPTRYIQVLKVRKKRYVITQSVGLIAILIAFIAIWFTEFKSVNELLMPLLGLLIIFIYILFDYLAYRRANRIISTLINKLSHNNKEKTREHGE